MSYTIDTTGTNDLLKNSNGNVVYEWDGGYTWPDDSAIEAALNDAGIGNPQKELFKTLFLGPDIVFNSE